jgi:hypothetical protein
VAERKIKSLYRTGRISRAEARAVAERLRAETIRNALKKSGKILVSTTASGRGAIAFHVVFPAAAKRAAAGRSPAFQPQR